MNSEHHYLVVKTVANCSDCYYSLQQFLLQSNDVRYSFIIVHVFGAQLNFTNVIQIWHP